MELAINESVRVQSAEFTLQTWGRAELDAYAAKPNSDPVMVHVPENLYHMRPGASRSDLKTILQKSPRHAILRKDDEEEPTEAKRFGAMFHQYLLEPERFKATHVAMPNFTDMFGPMQSSKNRAKRDEWMETNLKGKTGVDPDDLRTLSKMVESASSLTVVQNLLRGGISEPSIYWWENGVLYKCRPDYLRKDRVIVDIKTIISADIDTFQSQVARYRYDLQDAHYVEGTEKFLGEKIDAFIFICVEKTEPYGVSVFTLDPVWRGFAKQDLDTAKTIYRECVTNNLFPGYPQEIQSVSCPVWHANRYK